MNALNPFAMGIFLVLAFGQTVSAQFTYPNCTNAVEADFEVTPMVTRTNDGPILEPLKMDFQMSADGIVDIYYIERGGNVKFYNGKTKAVQIIGTLAPEKKNEEGLSGMALDPDFKNKNRIFLYYAHLSGFRVSRFDMDPVSHQLNLSSEKVLLTILSGRDRTHTAGAMRFDAYGDLWINTGDNESLRKGPANTADFRGGMLRIHPNEDGTYSIPGGNMWEYAAKYFTDKGMPDIAAKYRDPAQMKREIYVKGMRDPYTLTLDPVRRWASYGDCGPDQASSSATDPKDFTEEQDIITKPSFRGWPFWTALSHVQAVVPSGYKESNDGAIWGDWSTLNMQAPINDHPEASGIDQLLPAEPGTYNYARSCAMTGPIYRYDGDLKYSGRLPPHFNRIWFVTDFNDGKIKALRLSEDGTKTVGNPVEIFSRLNSNLKKPLDFQQGPDGALYYLNYSCGIWYASDACTGIYKISYKGTCQDPALKIETAGVRARNDALHNSIEFYENTVFTHGNWGYTLEVLDINGKRVLGLSGEGEHAYPYKQLLAGKLPGIYFIRLTNAQGSRSKKFGYFSTTQP